MNLLLKRLLIISWLGLVLAVAGWSATYTWTGTAGDGDWSNPTNWNVGTNYPGSAANDVAVFSGTPSPVTISNYSVANAPTLTVNVTGGVTMNIAANMSAQYFNLDSPSLVTLNISSGITLNVTTTINFGVTAGANACNVALNGPGVIVTNKFDTNETKTNYIYMNNGMTITVNGTFFGNQNAGTQTIMQGDGTTSQLIFGVSAQVSNLYGTSAVAFNGVQVIDGSVSYSMSVSPPPAAGGTSTVTISGNWLTAQTFRYTAVRSTNNETYSISTISSITYGTTLTNFDLAAGIGTYTFTVTFPAHASGNSLTLVVYPPTSNVPIGTLYFYDSTANPTWTGGAGTSYWATGGNWSTGSQPSTPNATITIPAGCSFYPKLTAGVSVGAGSTLIIDPAASLELDSYTISNVTTLTNNGTLILNAGSSFSPTTISLGPASKVEYNGGTGVPSIGYSYAALQIDAGCTLNCTGPLAVSGTLTDNGTLNQNSGTLTMAGYSGSGAVNLANSTTLTTTGSAAIATLGLTGTVTLNGGTITATAGNYTASPDVTTTGSVSLPGGTFGALTISSGSLSLGSAASTATGVGNSGTLNLGGNLTGVGTLTNNGSLAMASGTILGFAAYSGTGSVSTIAGTINATGAGGTIGNLSVTTSVALNGSIAVTAATYNATPAVATTGTVSIPAGAFGALTVGSGALTLGSGASSASSVTTSIAAATLNMGGNLTGAATVGNAGVINMGSGTSLGFGSYSGGGSISTTSGTINVTGAGGTVATLAVTTGATLAVTTGTLIVTGALSGAIAASATTGEIDLNGSSLALSVGTGLVKANGGISGTVAFTGAGTLDMNGNSLTLTGDLTVNNAASLALSNGSLAGGAHNIVVANGTLNAGGTASVGNTGNFQLTNAASSVTVGTGAFAVGAYSQSGGTFTQTGANAVAGSQTVASLAVTGGTCVWDSGSNGGDLAIAGMLSNAGSLAFNHKNVSLGTGLSGNLTFYDLTIPGSKTLAPNAGTVITVLRNFSVASGGGYTPGTATLVLGGSGGVAGNVSDYNGTPVDLGALVVDTVTKTMLTAIRATSVDIRNGGTLLTSTFNLTSAGNVATTVGTGTLTASTTEQLNVGGNFSVTTFNRGNSKVVFDGAGSATNGYSFYDLEMNLTTSAAALTPSAGITVTHAFTQTQGTFTAGSYLHQIAGAWDSSSTNVNLNSGSSTVELTGTNPTVTLRSGQSFYNLTIDNGAALGYDLTLTHDLTVSAGTVTANSHALALNGTGSQTVATNGSNWYDLTIANRAAGTVTFNNPLNVGDAFTVGGAGAYNVTINNGGTATPAVSFANTGTLTIAAGYTFSGGATATAPSSVDLGAGTVATTGGNTLSLGQTAPAHAVNVNGAATLQGGTGAINLGPVGYGGIYLLTVGNGAATPINFLSSVTGSGGNGSLTINTTAVVAVSGAVSSLDTITVTNSGGIGFSSTVAAKSAVLTATTGTIDFQGALTLTTGLADTGGTFALKFDSAVGGQTSTIAGATTLGTSGAITFGNATADSITFTGGLTSTSTAYRYLAGTLAGGAITLNGTGTIEATANATIAPTATNSATVGDVTLDDNVTLTLGSGVNAGFTTGAITGTTGGAASNLTINTTGTVSIGGAVGTDIGTVTVTNSGGTAFAGTVNCSSVSLTATTGTIDFQNALTATSLTNGGGGFDLRFDSAAGGQTSSITNFVNLGTSGVVYFGNDPADSITFTGGVAATAPTKHVAGTIAVGGAAALNFGTTATTVDNDTHLNAVTGTITLGPVAYAAGDPTLYAGNGSNSPLIIGTVTGYAGTPDTGNLTINVSGAAATVSVGTVANMNTVTVTNSNGTAFTGTVGARSGVLTATTGTIDFQGALTLTTGLTDGGGTFALKFNSAAGGQTSTVAGTTTLGTSGAIAFGNDPADIITFTGGLTATSAVSPSIVSLAGILRSTNGTINLGATTILTSATISTQYGASGGGDISIQGNLNATNTANDVLTLDAGTGAIDYRGVAPITTSPHYIRITSAGSLTNAVVGGYVAWDATPLFIDAAGSTIALGKACHILDLVVYNGTVNVAGMELIVRGDAVFYGSGYNPDDPNRTGATGQFAYPNAGAVLLLPLPGTRSGALVNSVAGGALKVVRNFYANGATFNAAANWQLWLTSKDRIDNLNAVLGGNGIGNGASANNDYAVAFNASVANCAAVDQWDGSNWTATTGTEYVNCAENPGTVTNSPQWITVRPTISSARTIYDDMVEVVFNTAIENSNNEIQRIVNISMTNDLRFNDAGANYRFYGVFYWDDTGAPLPYTVNGVWEPGEPGTFVAVTANTDIPAGKRLYFKTSTAAGTYGAYRWNTDATGTSAGGANSTDRSGTAQATVVRLILEKARLFAANGKTMNANIGVDNAGFYNVASAFMATTDACRPVLVGAYAGHAAYDSSNTVPYNGHNFMYLKYSEPLDLSAFNGVDATGAAVSAGTATADTSYRSAAAIGFMSGAGTVAISGLGLSYPGNLTTGARASPLNASAGNANSINSIYRGPTVGSTVNPGGYAGLTIFVAGFSFSDGSKLCWPGYLNGLATANTDPSGATMTQGAAASVLDAAGNTVEPTSNAYVGKAGGTTGVTISSALAGAGFGAGPVGGWDVTAPGFKPAGTNYEVYTTVNGSNQINLFSYVMTKNIRDSSMLYPNEAAAPYDATEDGAFTFGTISMGTFIILPGVSFSTSVLIPAYSSPNVADDNFFSFSTTQTTWDNLTSLYFSYDHTVAYATDLAGNLLPDAYKFGCIDRTPPNIQLSLGVVGGYRLFVQFDKPVVYDSSGAGTGPYTYDNIPPAAFTVTDGTTILVPVKYELLDSTDMGTGQRGATKAFLTLDSAHPLTPDMVMTYYWHSTDSVSIRDKYGNPMLLGKHYPISNMGINVVKPILASDDITRASAGDSLGPVQVFDGSTGLIGEGNINVEVRKETSSLPAAAYADLPVNLYYDVGVSSAYRAFGNSAGFWSPVIIDGLLGSTNPSAKLVVGVSAGAGTGLTDFTFAGNYVAFKTGNKVEFMLSMNGLPCAWSPDVNDPRSIRPWSFTINAAVAQRGGATIVNNVINPTVGDKTYLEYSVKRPGMVTVIVLTIDGNVVRVLQQGQQPAAEKYRLSWDGKNQSGNIVARGLYLVRVVGPDMDEIRKVLVVKP